MSHEWSGKVSKFHGAIANGVWYRPEKLQGGGAIRPPPPIIGLRYRVSIDLIWSAATCDCPSVTNGVPPVSYAGPEHRPTVGQIVDARATERFRQLDL